MKFTLQFVPILAGKLVHHVNAILVNDVLNKQSFKNGLAATSVN